MNTLTLKIPDAIKEKLKLYAQHKGVSNSQVVREALLAYFAKEPIEKKGTFGELAKDIAGSVDGPSDLSSNKGYLSGYGKRNKKIPMLTPNIS